VASLVHSTHSLSQLEDEALGSFRVVAVHQRHERTGRVTTLLDAEGLCETKTDFRKRHFSYKIEGLTEVEVKSGNWLASPRGDVGQILEVELLSTLRPSRRKHKRIALRVQFNETGIIRLNELWFIYSRRPITHSTILQWEKRMTDGAQEYYQKVLPTVIDSVLHQKETSIDGEQLDSILLLQLQILRKAIRIAETQQVIRLTSTQLVRATKEVLAKVA
jgi:hypothetical protein